MRNVIIVLGLLLVAGCGAVGQGGQLYQVRYQVTVAGDINEVSVTWTGSSKHGRNATRRVKIAPGGTWQETATVPRVSAARLSAASVNGKTGTITCTIYKGLVVIDRQVSPNKVNPQVSCTAEQHLD